MTAARPRPGQAPAGAALAFDGFRRQWSAWCRDAVLDLLDTLSNPGFIDRAAGSCLPAAAHEALQAAWAAPCRSAPALGGALLRPLLVCLLMQAFGRDPREAPVAVALPAILHAASLALDGEAPWGRGTAGGRPIDAHVADAAATWLNAGFELLAHPVPGLDDATAARLVDALAWAHWANGMAGPPGTQRPAAPGGRLALEIGAIAAGATPGQVRRLADFGEALGPAGTCARQARALAQALDFLPPADRLRLAGFADCVAEAAAPW
ncbi:hypothetical protein ACT80S_03855 [Ramlibacter sp. MAHUQ-53]|uniref:hypothetical protein n=1 Tax=unclassified Ramlibacter TaxID=2617605 RepID=UPI003636D235